MTDGVNQPLNAAEIRDTLLEVANRLPDTRRQRVIIVTGGALLAFHNLRATTYDVDSIRRLDAEVVIAAESVASDRGLPLDWLNSNAAGFVPATFDVADCEVLAEHPRLLVLGMSLRQAFLMKVYAGRARDRSDLVRMWQQCHFGSPQECVDEFWTAYPDTPADEFLLDWIIQIANEAS